MVASVVICLVLLAAIIIVGIMLMDHTDLSIDEHVQEGLDVYGPFNEED